MNDNALVVRDEMSLAETMTLGKTLAASKYFDDAKEAAQAVVKILAGREIGLGPIASMTGIHIIKKKVTMGANLMAAAVKRDPRYDYQIVELTPERCELVFSEKGREIGRSTFTIDEARKAGVGSATPPGKSAPMLQLYPRNMLFARAISNGVKWYCPDAFGGAPVYTPEELGATVDGDGEMISVPSRVVHPETKRDEIERKADAAEAKREIDDLDAPTSADLDYVPDWIDTEATDRWAELRNEATAHLGYSHDNHVKNTLKKIVDGDAGGLTYRSAWHLLQEHQRSKEENSPRVDEPWESPHHGE